MKRVHVKVISHKAGSPPRTRTVQSYSPGCANLHTPIQYIRSASAPYRCCPLPSRFEYIDRAGHVLAYPGPATFRPQNCPFLCGDLDPHIIRGSPGQLASKSQTASRSAQPTLHSSRQSDSYFTTSRKFSTQNCPFACGNPI